MSALATSIVWDADASPLGKLALLYIADNAGDDLVACVLLSRLADFLGVEVEDLPGLVLEPLEADGLLEHIAPPDHGAIPNGAIWVGLVPAWAADVLEAVQ